MIILKLTEVRHRNGDIATFPTYLNMDHVVCFNVSDKGRDTHVKLKGSLFMFVKETPEQIMSMMNMENTE